MFSYICCNLSSLFFILVIFKKPPRQKTKQNKKKTKKKRDKMIIFMTCISTEFSSQFGFKTTRGIVAQLFLKILKLVCFKKCVSVKLTEANHYCFGCKRFRQSNKNESLPKKKKEFPLYVQFQKDTRSPTFSPIFWCQFPNSFFS